MSSVDPRVLERIAAELRRCCDTVVELDRPTVARTWERWHAAFSLPAARSEQDSLVDRMREVQPMLMGQRARGAYGAKTCSGVIVLVEDARVGWSCDGRSYMPPLRAVEANVIVTDDQLAWTYAVPGLWRTFGEPIYLGVEAAGSAEPMDEVQEEVLRLRALLGRHVYCVDGRIEQACPACLVTLSLRMPVNDVAQLHGSVFRFFDDHRCYTRSMSTEQLAATIARAERASDLLAARAQALRVRELAGAQDRTSLYERAELESVKMAELAQWLARQQGASRFDV